MDRLLTGYKKFRAEAFPERKDHFRLLSTGQAPEVLFITCADSRVVPDLILQSEPGDLFLCRNAGNVIPPGGEMAGGVSATIEYAVEVLKVKHVIVCGHSDCGAVKAALDPTRGLETLPLTEQWLHFIKSAWNYMPPNVPDEENARHTALIHANVIAQLNHLKSHPEIAKGLEQGTIQVHGWYYDILTGDLEAYAPAQNRFVPIDEYAAGLPAIR
jgi:carbonic anhydrase